MDYRNEVWDMLEKFYIENRVMVIPIIQNRIADSLATSAGKIKILVYSNKKYKIEL